MSNNPRGLWGSCGGRGQVNKAGDGQRRRARFGMGRVVGGQQRGAGEKTGDFAGWGWGGTGQAPSTPGPLDRGHDNRALASAPEPPSTAAASSQDPSPARTPSTMTGSFGRRALWALSTHPGAAHVKAPGSL